MEGGLTGFEEVYGLHLAVAGNAFEVLAVLQGLNLKRNQFFMKFVVRFLYDTLGQRVLLDYSWKVTTVKNVLSDNKRSYRSEVVSILSKELILSPIDSHQAAAVSDSKVILVQTVKLRNKLLALFLYSLHVLNRYVYPHLHCVLLWLEEGSLMRLRFSAFSYAFYQPLPSDCFYSAVACSDPYFLVIVHHYLCDVMPIF